MAVFHGCQIALELPTSLSFKKKQELRKAIADNAGVVSYIVNKKSSYLVVGEPEKTDVSYKCKTALKLGIPIVDITYIRDCVQRGQQLDPDLYVVCGTTKAQRFGSGKIVATRNQPQKKAQRLPIGLSVSGVQVWSWGQKDAPIYDEHNYEVAKSCVLQKFDKHTDATSFCVLELHVMNSANAVADNFLFRIFSHHGSLRKGKGEQIGKKEGRYVKTSDDALGLYSQLYSQQIEPPNNLTKTRKVLSMYIGSDKFKQQQSSLGLECYDDISEGVKQLVEQLWQEANGEIEDNLAVPINQLKIDQVEMAEAVLHELWNKLDGKHFDDVSKLSDEFYLHLPHKQMPQLKHKADIASKHNLCQLLRDMLSVSEATNWAIRSSIYSKYRALRCHIQEIREGDPELKEISKTVIDSQIGDQNIKVHKIFAIHRSVEDAAFKKQLHNKRLLFHASASKNFVGILSSWGKVCEQWDGRFQRELPLSLASLKAAKLGLLLPRIVVGEYGGTRSDAGMLGCGLYFADSSTTSVKYSSPSKICGTRMMAVCEVALGDSQDVYSYDTSLTTAPTGCHSVHGVSKNSDQRSDFESAEFVVYSTSQQHLQYLVEFTCQNDKVKEVIMLSEEGIMEKSDERIPVTMEDVENITDPLLKVRAGLVSSRDVPVPLKSVHIRAKLMDLATQVTVLQEYYNWNNTAIEAKYVFPLGELAVVCGFEAFINNKHIVGEVKEKEQAHRDYREAVSRGHGAYLMDQDEETPDVFIVSVGNLPPAATVLIKIVYVAELQVDGDNIIFNLPASVAPWKQSRLDMVTQSDVDTVKVDQDKQKDVSIQIAIEMPFEICSIECPSHKIKTKKTVTHAVVEMAKNQALDDGFQLLIGLAEIHVPRMWVETNPDDEDSQACMLTFYPEFEAATPLSVEIVFLLDLSNSMDGATLMQAKKVLLLALSHLSSTHTINVVTFGTTFDELFPSSRPVNKHNLQLATKFVQDTEASMGNTELYRPLHAYFLLCPKERLRNIILVSDGHINNEKLTLQAIRTSASHTRVFTCGISATANRHLLRNLAHAGAGHCEHFDAKGKSRWQQKVEAQLERAAQPGLSAVTVQWQQYADNLPLPTQAPRQITALFHGARQVIYGFVPNCLQATLKAEIDGQEVSTMVSTSELNVTTGKILHRLTARAVIRDWEDGTLAEERTAHDVAKKHCKNQIIQLSTRYSIVTQFTSFVAIEHREKDEVVRIGPSISELVANESVDILDYIDWESDPTIDTMYISVEDKIASLCEEADVHADTLVNRALACYEEALQLAERELPSTHPQRLATSFALSTFYHDILADEEKAVKLAKKAFDDSIDKLDCLSEESYKDSTLILKQLRDNLTLWTQPELPGGRPRVYLSSRERAHEKCITVDNDDVAVDDDDSTSNSRDDLTTTSSISSYHLDDLNLALEDCQSSASPDASLSHVSQMSAPSDFLHRPKKAISADKMKKRAVKARYTDEKITKILQKWENASKPTNDGLLERMQVEDKPNVAEMMEMSYFDLVDTPASTMNAPSPANVQMADRFVPLTTELHGHGEDLSTPYAKIPKPMSRGKRNMSEAGDLNISTESAVEYECYSVAKPGFMKSHEVNEDWAYLDLEDKEKLRPRSIYAVAEMKSHRFEVTAFREPAVKQQQQQMSGCMVGMGSKSVFVGQEALDIQHKHYYELASENKTHLSKALGESDPQIKGECIVAMHRAEEDIAEKVYAPTVSWRRCTNGREPEHIAPSTGRRGIHHHRLDAHNVCEDIERSTEVSRLKMKMDLKKKSLAHLVAQDIYEADDTSEGEMNEPLMDPEEQHQLYLDEQFEPFYVNPYQTSDEDQVTTSLNVACGIPLLTADSLVKLFRLQHNDGYWELSSSLDDIIAIDNACCEDVLTSAGLESLGMKAAQDIKRLIATLLVLTRLIGNLNMTPISMVVRAWEYCVRITKLYPMACSILEMGSSWSAVVGEMLGFQDKMLNPCVPNPAIADSYCVQTTQM